MSRKVLKKIETPYFGAILKHFCVLFKNKTLLKKLSQSVFSINEPLSSCKKLETSTEWIVRKIWKERR